MESVSVPLDSVAELSVGINTGNKGIRERLLSREPAGDTWHRVLLGRDTSRYSYHWEGWWVAYDPELVASFGKLGRTLPPARFFEEPKILVQRTRRGLNRKLNAAYDADGMFCLNRLTSIIRVEKGPSLHYLLGLLNSRVLDYYFQNKFTEWEVKPAFLRRLPMVVPKPESTNQRLANDVGRLAERMVAIRTALTNEDAMAGFEVERLNEESQSIEREIDRLVCELYELNDEEWAVVEASVPAE